jgi:phospho-N-acetylmuramoyl-pentapeptide-transferase
VTGPLLPALLLCGLAFGLTVGLTRPLIGWLAARQLGKAIREDGPAHAAKAGTPTMGGLGLLAAVALVGGLLAVGWPPGAPGVAGVGGAAGAWPIWLTLAAMAGFAVLGLADDLHGLARKGRAREIGVGLTARQMILGQALFAAAVCAAALALGTRVIGPGPFGSNPLAFLALGILAIVGSANGTNLADGLDGLAAGLAALAFTSLGASMAITQGGVDRSALLAWVIAASCLGFLVYNRYPARVFMGNLTSLALGAGLATLALLAGGWWLLPVIGAVFVVEVASDLIQVAYFKWSGGRRVFRMAPIHHHFELVGWSEQRVVQTFWLAGLVSGLSGILLTVLL